MLCRSRSRAASLSAYLVDRIQAHDRIDLRLETHVTAVAGDGWLREPSGRGGSVVVVTPFEVREIVRRLRAAYPDPPLGDESADLYARMLVDLPYEAVDPVVDELIATAMKLPTVSRIRRSVVEPTLDIPTADEAWLAVQTHSGDLHELVAHVVRLVGGTYNIRTSADPELARVRFVKVYDELRRKAVDRALAEGIRVQRLKLQQVS